MLAQKTKRLNTNGFLLFRFIRAIRVNSLFGCGLPTLGNYEGNDERFLLIGIGCDGDV